MLSTHNTGEPIITFNPSPTVYATTEAEANSTEIDPSAKYAKKPRHKVKADTYEYKGTSQTKNSIRKRKQAGGAMGNENFHAANVDAERVTLKPNSDQFIFSRSRKSLPLPGQDMPDLTFTKMNYLSRPPRNTHRKAAQIAPKDDAEEYIVRRDKEISGGKIPIGSSHNQSTALRSDMYSTRFATDKEQNIRVREPCDNNVVQSPHQTIGKLNWVKNEGDPRVEELRLPVTNRDTHTSTPISWSTSPSRNIKHSDQAGCRSGRQAISLLSQDQIEMTGQTMEPESRNVQSREDRASHYSDKLTQDLLKRDLCNNVASSSRSAAKTYCSLEDLKRMANEIFGQTSTNDLSALQTHLQTREPSPSGQNSRSAPSPAHGPSVYIGDVIMHQHDPVGFLAHISTRQDQDFEFSEYVGRRSKHLQYRHVDRDAQEADWYTVVAHLSERQWVPVTHSDQGHESAMRTERPSPPLTGVSQSVKPRRTPCMHQHDAVYSGCSDGRLDAFDLELLKTVQTDDLEQDSGSGEGPTFLEVDSPSWIRCLELKMEANQVSNQRASFSVRSPTKSSLDQPLNDPEQVEGSSLRLVKPSLECNSIQQDFNLFRRSCLLL